MGEFPGRVRAGGLAMLFTLAAAASMFLLSRVTVVANSDHTLLYQITSWIFFGASFGPLVKHLRWYCELFVWNATGWSMGLAMLGLDTVGAMPLWPIMLAVVALTFWPRERGESLPASAVIISVLGGIIVCWLAWSQPDLSPLGEWVDGL